MAADIGHTVGAAVGGDHLHALAAAGVPPYSALAIDRQSLRMPFYSQCFLLTPFALMLQSALLLHRLPAVGQAVSTGLGLAAIAWFLWAQTS